MEESQRRKSLQKEASPLEKTMEAIAANSLKQAGKRAKETEVSRVSRNLKETIPGE